MLCKCCGVFQVSIILYNIFLCTITFRDFGKTLKKQVRKTAGLKPHKPSDRKTRYMLSSRGSMRGIPPSLAEELDGRPDSLYGDEDNWSSKCALYFYRNLSLYLVFMWSPNIHVHVPASTSFMCQPCSEAF